MSSIQRIITPGDHWLYVKIYTGFKTADLLIADVIAPLANELMDNKLIGKWFFIRYTDPEFHLRVRFFLTERSNLGIALQMLNDTLQVYIQKGLVWKVQKKVEFITMVKDRFTREFELENSRPALSDKYRVHRNSIEELLGEKSEKHRDKYMILKARSALQIQVAHRIMQYVEKGEKLNALISSYTHMMMNRWFRSKQRMHEAVVYD